MISGFGWAALALLFGYLALFFWGSALAAQAAGRPVWLFARATGRDRLAAIGFRAAFALAFFGPLLWLAVPALHKVDPLWTEGRAVLLGLVGVFVAGLGAMVAFAAQMSMGSSWRVGVVGGETGDLVSRRALPVQPQPDLCGASGTAGRCCDGGSLSPYNPRPNPVSLVGQHASAVRRGRPAHGNRAGL